MQFCGNLPLLSNIADTANFPRMPPSDTGIKNNTRVVAGGHSLTQESAPSDMGIKNNTRAMAEWSDNK